MPQHFPVLRALALLLPLSFAAAPPTLLAKEAQHAGSVQKKSSAVVAKPFPADAAQHAQQLNAQATMPELSKGDKGPAVVRAQVMLDRDWFSVGEIDGVFGHNMERALNAFQTARGLPVTGKVDAATWSALAQGQAPVFATYVLTDKDVNGPYEPLPHDPVALSQLPALGYQSLGEALGERFHMSPKLLHALNEGRDLRAGQAIVVADVGRAAALPAQASAVRIEKSAEMLYILGAGGQVLGAFPVSIGSSQDPLPLGMLKITSEVKNPDYSYDPSLLRNPKADEKLRLPPGPNSPVGVLWMGLTKDHWGIHGTSEPSQMSRVETNGCVRLTNWDAVRLGTVIGIGTPVEVQS
jgi:lipoprotein-anchoring transpeptidase ErfK/SrfK